MHWRPYLESLLSVLFTGQQNKEESVWKPGDNALKDYPNAAAAQKVRLAVSHPNLRGVTPFQLFKLFFDDELKEYIIVGSQRYAAQKNFKLKLEGRDLNTFVGVMLYTGVVNIPSQRMFWERSNLYNFPTVSRRISLNRFEVKHTAVLQR